MHECYSSGEQSIAYAALDALRKSPVDARAALLRNMIVIGGTSLLPGTYSTKVRF